MTTDEINVTGGDVLMVLRPGQGWSIMGDDFDSIVYDEGVEPVTKKEFVEGFAKAREQKIQKMELTQEKRLAALAKLTEIGLTTDDIRALGLA